MITKDCWKHLPFPKKTAPLELNLTLSDVQADNMMLGHKPSSMDDKWFVYSEGGWVYFLRSWTGTPIFGLKLDGSPAGVRVVDSWVSRDTEQYKSIGIAEEREMLLRMISFLFPY